MQVSAAFLNGKVAGWYMLNICCKYDSYVYMCFNRWIVINYGYPCVFLQDIPA